MPDQTVPTPRQPAVTDDGQLATIDCLIDLTQTIAEHMRAVIVDCHENDREALREGVVTVEVGCRHLIGEIEAIRGGIVAASGR